MVSVFSNITCVLVLGVITLLIVCSEDLIVQYVAPGVCSLDWSSYPVHHPLCVWSAVREGNRWESD